MCNEILIKDVYNNWIEDCKKRVKLQTLKFYSGHFNKHIMPIIGDLCIDVVPNESISKVYDSLDSNHPWLPRLTKGVLVHFFNYAARCGYIKRRPNLYHKAPVLKNVDKSKTIQELLSPLSHDDIKHAMPYIKKSCYSNFFLFVLYTGLSRNEALALKWENISNDCSFINITEKCEFNEENEFDYRIIKVSKNEERTILITSKAKELLKEMRKQNNEGFIFVDNNRDNLKICSLINAFRNIQKKIRNKNFNITNITKYFTVYYLQEYLNDFELSYYEGDFVRTYLNNVKPDYFGFEKKMQMIDEALERNIEV